MTYSEAIEFLEAPTGASPPTLERMRVLLSALGDPQQRCRCIHVAGTNGKGSVCAMLDAILRAAGYRVGRFTSPSIRLFNDRIAVDGMPISDDALVRHADRVRNAMERTSVLPNSFERTTAVAFSCFAEAQVDFVVLEVGLGGRFDPTNAIDSSLLSIITEIDFDHTHLLGNTLQAIAAEKAGIIKSCGKVLYGGKDNSAIRTIASIAQLRHATLSTVDRSRLQVHAMTPDGTTFDFAPYEALALPLLGAYQPQNAATALTAIELLSEQGVSVSDTAIRQGLSSVVWPARFECLKREPTMLFFDGAHNAQGVRLAMESVRTYFPEERILLLTGVMKDKDYDVMIEAMKPIAKRVYTVPADASSRALSAEAYAEQVRSHRMEVQAFGSIAEGLRAAMKDSADANVPLLCLGSLHLYAPILEALKK